jgi:hypothetical protein
MRARVQNCLVRTALACAFAANDARLFWASRATGGADAALAREEPATNASVHNSDKNRSLPMDSPLDSSA